MPTGEATRARLARSSYVNRVFGISTSSVVVWQLPAAPQTRICAHDRARTSSSGMHLRGQQGTGGHRTSVIPRMPGTICTKDGATVDAKVALAKKAHNVWAALIESNNLATQWAGADTTR